MNSPRKLDGIPVLVVDDDPDILEVMSLALSSEGAAVTTASTGDEAITAFAAAEPDIVILDMMLPRRSGFLVLERIQQEADAPPVVMVTANEGRRHKVYAETLGVSAYLNKPVPMERLVETVLGLLEDKAE